MQQSTMIKPGKPTNCFPHLNLPCSGPGQESPDLDHPNPCLKSRLNSRPILLLNTLQVLLSIPAPLHTFDTPTKCRTVPYLVQSIARLGTTGATS